MRFSRGVWLWRDGKTYHASIAGILKHLLRRIDHELQNLLQTWDAGCLIWPVLASPLFIRSRRLCYVDLQTQHDFIGHRACAVYMPFIVGIFVRQRCFSTTIE